MLIYQNLDFYQRWSYIILNIQFVISAFGVMANMLTFCVFCRKRFFKSSFCFYARIMTITDSLSIVSSLRSWPIFFYNDDLDLFSPILCKFDVYFNVCFKSISTWILTLIIIDRLLSIVYANRFAFTRKERFQASMVAIVVVVNLLFYVLLPIKYQWGSQTGKFFLTYNFLFVLNKHLFKCLLI